MKLKNNAKVQFSKKHGGGGGAGRGSSRGGVSKKGASQKPIRKGDQCTQNPGTRKFRAQVKPSVITQGKTTGLTQSALEEHNEKIEEDAISEMGGLAISDTTGVTRKSKAFSISGLTDCSNMTFNKVIDKWNSNVDSDKEKCAILAAVTEVIRSKGGKETESEYFAALMTVLEATQDSDSVSAILYLLTLVTKKVPTALLKAKFSEAAKMLVPLLEGMAQDGKTSTLIYLIECLSTLLLPQEPQVWSEPSTLRTYQILLSFVVHTKPKVRKTAQRAVLSLMRVHLNLYPKHPIGSTTAKFCLTMMQNHSSETSTSTNYILNMLKLCLQHFREEYVKELCETLLSVMQLNDVILKTNSMQTLHGMFSSQPSVENLTPELNGKIIAALYEFQPSVNDVHVASAWLTLMEEAHANLTLIKSQDSDRLSSLPKFFGSIMTFFASEHRQVSNAAVATLKSTTEKCVETDQDFAVEELESKNAESSLSKIFNLLESGMKYKYQPVWNRVLQILAYYFEKFGRRCSKLMVKCVVSLIDLKEADGRFPFMTDLNKAVGEAFKAMGPRVILDLAPLNLVHDGECSFPRGWLLPLMADYVQETELKYFISNLLPAAAQLKQKGMTCRAQNRVLEVKVYETLHKQIWALLPGFCTRPTDLKESFKNIAKVLGTALMERTELRGKVLHALRTLITKSEQDNTQVIGQFSKNYMPILFNLYTSDNEDCRALSVSILETMRSFLIITDVNLINTFATKVAEKLASEEESKEKRHHLMDLSILMVKYVKSDLLDKFYRYAIDNLESSDKSIQKKCYRIIEETCESNSAACKDLFEANMEDMKTAISGSLSQAASSSKAPRLRCLSHIIKRMTAADKDYIMGLIPEVILCTKEVGTKAKSAAFEMLVEIGSVLVFIIPLAKEEVVREYLTVCSAGLAGSPHMISATLLAFTKLLFEYRDCLDGEQIGALFSAAISLLKSKTREVVRSSLLFVRAMVTILDANESTEHLPGLMKNLFTCNMDTSSAYRNQLKVIFERLLKKVGFETIRAMCPVDHRRFIIHIHKSIVKTKKQREAYKQEMENKDEDMKGEKNSNEQTWEDILGDTYEDDEEGGKKVEKTTEKKDSKAWIVEGEGSAVDLLDPKMARNIVGTKPKNQKPDRKAVADAGFKTSAEGKLMITMDDSEEEEVGKEKQLDVGEKDILGGHEGRTPKNLKLGKRKMNEEMPEKDTIFQGYQPGGSGIHRKTEANANTTENPKRNKPTGDEYRAKKARGDVKLKGKPDPYAYLPLNKQKLNKRKKMKLQGQFEGLVKAAGKGAATGAAAANKHGKKKHEKAVRFKQ